MWPGSSPAWRKRQPSPTPNTRPRFGNNVNPPETFPSSSISSDSTGPSWILQDQLLFVKRKLDDEAGAEDESEVAATTFNNGMWTPAAATAVVSATQPALTATMTLATTSEEDPARISTVPSTTSALLKPSSSLSSRIASQASLSPSSSSSTSSSSATISPLPNDKTHNETSTGSGNGGFKLVYLTPIVVFVGLLLLFSVGGRVWGRYHLASRVEAARRAKYDKRASRQAKKREMQRIKSMWGYDCTPVLPPELEPGEHDLHYKDPNATKHRDAIGDGGDSSIGSSSDAGEDETYPGTFKILSLALLGEGRKQEPPQTRGEGGRKYETGVQSNSWLSVKLRRWVGRDEREFAQESKYTIGPHKFGSRRLRHVLSRD